MARRENGERGGQGREEGKDTLIMIGGHHYFAGWRKNGKVIPTGNAIKILGNGRRR